MFTQEEKQIIEYGKQNGKSAIEVKQALAKYREQTGWQPPQQEVAPVDTVGSRVSGVIQNAGSNVADAIAGDGKFAGESSIRRGTEATAEAFKAVPGIALAATPQPVRDALGAAGKFIGAGFSKLTNLIGSNKDLQNWVIEHPDAAKVVEEMAGTAKAGGEIAGTILLADQTAKGLQAVSNKVGTGKVTGYNLEDIPQDVSNIKDTAIQTGEDLVRGAKQLKQDVQLTLAEQNVEPQLKTSAERLVAGQKDPLFMEGASKRVKDPVTTYESYLEQSKKAITDIKADPAISTVGEKMGDAFKSVVQQRRAVGKVMGEELKKVGDITTNIDDVYSNFETALQDSGVTYDAVAKKLILSDVAKMPKEDITLLQQYIDDFNRLGSNPSIAEIDAHLARTQGMVDYFKAGSGMTGTTNAERLIKATQSSLREVLDPQKSGIAELEKYAQARKAYSQLSDFIDEGSGYLGKMTQSGDFAKDASIAKSAVQSILNNGKKDWMFKLEELTGYNATDDAVLALQAMKDAGDFRGLSLLQAMSETIPTTANSLSQRIVEWALKQGARATLGTPAEQTKAFLQSLKSQQTLPAVEKAVTNHLTTASQIIENTPADKLASMGGLPEVLSRTKTNIVDGLKASRMIEASNAVSQLSVGSFATLDAFKNAVMSAVKKLPIK